MLFRASAHGTYTMPPSALLALLAVLAAPADTSAVVGPIAAPVVLVTGPAITSASAGLRAPEDTVRRARPRSVEVSEWYERRLRLHRYGSYAMYPLFAVQAIAGNQLYQDPARRDWVRTTHKTAAAALGGVFTLNTVTGLWNLWDSRHTEQGRTRRFVHSAIMLASDAGLAYTGLYLADEAKTSFEKRREHRNWAFGSIATGVAGAGMMLVWKE